MKLAVSAYIPPKKAKPIPLYGFAFLYQIIGADTMARAVYTKDEYTVIKNKRGHVIINTRGTFAENHAHIKHLSTCKMVIGLIKKKTVPDSSYLKETAKRLSLDKKYIEKVNNKTKKDANKQSYFNPSKGVVRK